MNRCRGKALRILLIYFLFLPGVTNADEALQRPGPTSYWRWGFGVGTGLHQMRDDMLIPLRFTGPSIGFKFSLMRISTADEHRISFNLASAAAFDRFGHAALSLSGGGSYLYLRRTSWILREHSEIWVGGSFIGSIDDMYYIQWDDAHLYWMTIYAAGPSVAYKHQLKGNRSVDMLLQIPLIGWISRSPEERINKVDDLIFLKTWITQPHENMKFSLIPDFLLFDLSVAYRVSPRTRYLYELIYRTYPEPQTASLLNHKLGIEWTFGGKR